MGGEPVVLSLATKALAEVWQHDGRWQLRCCSGLIERSNKRTPPGTRANPSRAE
jgi:hypothetical protein